MGKSPGKWIKGFFGQKTSKSNVSKGRELTKSASEKPTRVSSRESLSSLTVDAPIISTPVPIPVTDRIDYSGVEKREVEKLANDGAVSSSIKQDVDTPTVQDPGQPDDSEKVRLEQAATVVQAALRSYQARHEFQSLKGIIRLQAVVRGRLVRRQALATLFCIQGIVKFQAIARGHMVRKSGNDNEHCRRQTLVSKDGEHQDSHEINKYSPAVSLSKNAFIYEILSSSPKAMPLRLQYGPGEPTSAWDWLLRWSISQAWTANTKHKETCSSKHLTVETEQSKPKHSVQRVHSAPIHSSSDTEKIKSNAKKLPGQPVKSAHEHPQTGSDKVKHGSRKITKPTSEMSNAAEMDVKKPKSYAKKLSKSPAPKLSEQTPNDPSDKPTEVVAKVVSEQSDAISSLELTGESSLVNQLNGHLTLEEHPELVSDKSQGRVPLDKDFKNEPASSGNFKCSRRISLPAKHDEPEATPASVKKVPSYMATTASSKAKVKAQVSPRFLLDAVDKNGLTRRYSLPPSTNGNLSSSPRVHRLIQANGKEGIKIDRSLSSSRDVSDKVIQADWKR